MQSLALAVGAQSAPQLNLVTGAIWIAMTFLSVTTLNHAFVMEQEGDCLRAIRLTGVGAKKIFFSKFISSMCMITIPTVIIVPIAFFAFRITHFPFFLPLMLIILTVAVGYVAVGLILSAMNAYSNSGERFLSIIIFPLLMPVMIIGVDATRTLFLGGDWSDMIGHLGYIAVYDIFFIALYCLVFEQAIEE